MAVDAVSSPSRETSRSRIEQLPDDVLLEIFYRLPCRSAVGRNSVSKRWCSLISHPNFIPHYINHRHQYRYIVLVWIELISAASAFPQFFFFSSFQPQWLTRSSVNSALVHCSRSHKLHFLSTFSLKMGPTALFTYLKIILLQYFQFSVFSFSKISFIQTDP